MRILCPSEMMNIDEEGDDTRCATCGCDLPEQDPDPENTGASPWWDGYCSEPCRKGVPVINTTHNNTVRGSPTMTRYIFFTTSDLTTGWPGKDRRESEEPIAHLPLDRDGSERPLWTTGRLEAAIEAGLVPVVLSSRARLFEHDAWWQSLVDEGHTHLMSSRGDWEFTAFCVDVLGSQYGLDWPTKDYGDGAEPMSWTGALKFLNQLLRPDGEE